MAHARSTGEARGAGAALRVFVVEDLPAVRAMIIEDLDEIDGLEVAGFAESEAEALAWLRAHGCDVLILDLELKQGNGLGVLKALAADETRPAPLRIVYSNHVTANIRRVAAQLGAAHFFDKTLDTPKLHALLRELSAGA